MIKPKTAIIIGAGSGVGASLAKKLAEKNYDLILSSRDTRTLNAIKNDLEFRFGNTVTVISIDLLKDISTFKNYVASCQHILGNISNLFITAGVSLDDDSGITSSDCINQLTIVNYQSIVLLLNEFAKVFINQASGSILVISSIAAHAPRSNNMVYASAKKGLEHYCLGLMHFLSKHNISVNIVALGYADTSLAYGKKLLFPKSSPEVIANTLISKSKTNNGLLFFPSYWKYITMLLNFLPWFIYKRLNF